MGDVVNMSVSANLPIRSVVQPYADRIELRFGRAYPVTLTIDRAALDLLAELINAGRIELDAASAVRDHDIPPDPVAGEVTP